MHQLRPSCLAAGLLLAAASALAKGEQVMLRPHPLHQLAGLLLAAASALAKGGQVMFRPQTLLELPLPSVPRPATVGKRLQHPLHKCLNEAWPV